MNILVFDTETNGKPKNYRASMADVDNWPRITQFAWVIAESHNGNGILSHQSLIKPDGWTVPKDQFFIDNNMSTDRCEQLGRPIGEVMNKFIYHLDSYKVDVIVAHNMAFDLNVVGAEMLRLKVKPSGKPIQVCTMEMGTNICRLPGSYGKFKWPRLDELYQYLFNKNFSGAHDALTDVHACRECFFEMVKRGVIKLPVEKVL